MHGSFSRMPSEKYSFSRYPDMITNGNTAIERSPPESSAV